ncbi:hypothetical protein PV325_013742 [Microctonus aethiopoides]|nr:hypothetical protein PV325_013742 [Microctonus aethiopoides]
MKRDVDGIVCLDANESKEYMLLHAGKQYLREKGWVLWDFTTPQQHGNCTGQGTLIYWVITDPAQEEFFAQGGGVYGRFTLGP